MAGDTGTGGPGRGGSTRRPKPPAPGLKWAVIALLVVGVLLILSGVLRSARSANEGSAPPTVVVAVAATVGSDGPGVDGPGVAEALAVS